MDRKLWRREIKHSKRCTWDGVSKMLTLGVGNCRACDDIKAIRSNGNEARGVYGIDKEYLKNFCKAPNAWERCTKFTNPSCACGKIVLQR